MTQGISDAPPATFRPARDRTSVALSVIVGVSLAILVVVPVASPPTTLSMITTLGALIVLGGAWLLLLRHTRHRVRTDTLRAVRGMLRDRMSDPLHTLLRAAAPPGDPPGPEERARISEIVNAVRSVESTLELISSETLEAWQLSRPPHRR